MAVLSAFVGNFIERAFADKGATKFPTEDGTRKEGRVSAPAFGLVCSDDRGIPQ